MPSSLLFLIWFLVSTVLAVTVLITILLSGIISGVHGAPYVPIKRRYVKHLLSWAGVSADYVFYDLGCGDARVLISAVKDFGVKKAIGYEVTLWPYLEARFARWSSGASGAIKIIRCNFFKADLRNASFVYMYLFPKPVDRLASKMAGELQVGCKILSVSFPIDLTCHPEFKLLKSEKFGKITAYLYIIVSNE